MTVVKQNLIGLKAKEFRHPLDLEATEALQQFPGWDIAVRTLLGGVAEQFFYLDNVASSVQVNEKQLPHIHKLLVEACQRLDLEVPELYIKQNPAPNAYTFAMRGKQPFIVLHTSLIELLTPEEIQAVIAHELGHLKCEHGVYLTLVNLLVLATQLLPNWGVILAQSLQDQMLEWIRCAEFSCDRAALLAVQDSKVIMSVLMKLAGGSATLAPQLNLDAFIEQARAYDKMSESQLGELLKNAQTQQLSHPVPVIRAQAIDRWASSADYQRLLDKHQSSYNGQVENKGKWRNW